MLLYLFISLKSFFYKADSILLTHMQFDCLPYIYICYNFLRHDEVRRGINLQVVNILYSSTSITDCWKVKFPHVPIYPSRRVGRLAGHDFLKGREVSCPCSHRGTCYFVCSSFITASFDRLLLASEHLCYSAYHLLSFPVFQPYSSLKNMLFPTVYEKH